MKTLYLDCGMGAAGDMLTAALLELFPEPDAVLAGLNAMAVPGVVFASQRRASHGITGSSVRVLVNGEEEPDCSGHICLNHGHGNGHDHSHGEDAGSDHGHGHDQENGHDHGHRHPHLYFHSHGHALSHSHADDYGQQQTETACHLHAKETAAHTHDHSGLHEHEHHHSHQHTSLAEMEARIAGLRLDARVRENVRAVFAMIASAEAKVHGQPLESVHFHEVGGMDALADIAAVCLLMDILEPDEVVVSPIHVGAGQVHCAHGILPVPAPATAEILKGIPVYGGQIQGELCTPTGAALLRHFADRFGPMPAMTVSDIGYGLGKRDFGQPNCLRAIIGTGIQEKEAGQTGEGAYSIADEVLELTCNLDDMTAENLAFACQILQEGGALDVWTMPAMMKKSRPGHLLCLLCRPEDRDRLLELVFQHTTTIGIREQRLGRYLLDRQEMLVQTRIGPVRCKQSTGFGIVRSKYEHDDLEAMALANGLSIAELLAILNQD